MNRKRESSSLIPSWFDITKYQVNENFPLLDWALNLSVRAQVNWQLTYGKDIDQAREWFDIIRENGFLNRNVTESFLSEAKADCRAEKYKPGFGIVYSLPLQRAIEICDFIQSDTKLKFNLAVVEDRRFGRKNETELYADWGECRPERWYREELPELHYDDLYDDYGSFSPHVCVDLNAPDETLVEAFKDWLKATRKNEGCEGANLPEKISAKLVDRWKNAAILPYLDLLSYQRLEGVTLPAHVIGNAIFPVTAVFDTTEAVRKTTRPNAEKALMNANGIMRHALIADELQKNGKKIG